MAANFATMDFNECLAAVRGATTASAFYTGPTPSELEVMYSRGFRGVNPSRYAAAERISAHASIAAMPSLLEVFPWARDLGKGKACAPYTAALHFDPNFGGDEAQTTGSCVTHGQVNAAEMDHSNDALHGETVWTGRLVKEALYKARGSNGAGWYCEAAGKYIGPDGPGGLLVRKKYDGPNGESMDFTTFSRANESWAANGRSGVPKWLEEIAAKNKAKWIIPIRTLEEYRVAIALGFGINVCSGYGYANTTDANGLAEQRGSWAHAMAHLAFNDTPWAHQKYGDLIGMIQQSWGKWNKQNGVPQGSPAMPVGAFYARASAILKMIRSDSFAVAGLWGFERTGWEAFDTVTELRDYLAKDSRVQDYMMHRHERVVETTARYIEESPFLTVSA